MKREYLKGLGLEEDVINKIMAEHGKGIESVKTELTTKETELQTLQGQLQTANKEIENFKDLDIDEIKQRAEKYKTDFEELQSKSKKQLADLKFEHDIEKAIGNAKARNIITVKALLDIDELKESKNQADDIKQALETIKKDNDYLFEPVNASGTGGSLGAGEKINNNITKTDILSIEDPIERKHKIAENLELFK